MPSLLVILPIALGAVILLRRPSHEHTQLNRARVALRRVLRTRKDVIQACEHPNLGPIDFRWGNDKGGICHVANKHPKDVHDIPEILLQGSIRIGKARVYITRDGYTLILARDFFGAKSNHWVITGYKKEETSAKSTRVKDSKESTR